MLIVEVKRGDIEGALKKLKGKFIDTKVVTECKERKEYVKKSVKKRDQKNKASYKQRKSLD